MTNLIALPSGTELVGDYRIERVLGAGGFGITYRADEMALDRAVTIKEYFPSDFAARNAEKEAVPRSKDCSSDYRWGLDRFIEEAQTLARFDHPNIVRVYRYFRANNTGYMVLQWEEGKSLKTWLKELKRAPRQKELDDIVAPLLEALDIIHKADFLHRDIAPDNIIVRKSGTPVLIDFGSARGEIAAHSKTVSALVKPGYSPYEQYAETSRQQGPWTDIYALAATLYHAVTGKRPPDAPSRMVHDEIVPAREAALSSYRPGFLKAIDRALSLEIKERPQSIAVWRGELLAPEPTRQGWLSKALDKKRDEDAAEVRDSKAPALAGAGNVTTPPPPDAPGPQGGLLDFLDNLNGKPAKKRGKPEADNSDADKRKPAAQGKAKGAERKAEASDASPSPAKAAGRSANTKKNKAGEGSAADNGAASTCKGEPPAANVAAQGAVVPAPRRRMPRFFAEQPKPVKPKSKSQPRIRPLAVKLAIGVCVAGAAVTLQNQLPKLATEARNVPTAAARLRPAVSPQIRSIDAHAGGTDKLQFSADGSRLYSVGRDRSLKVWRAASLELVRTIPLDTGPATALAIDGDMALTGHADGSVLLWDVATARKRATFRRNEADIWSLAFAGEQGRFLTATHDWKVALWDAARETAPLHIFDGHENAVQAVAYAANGQLFASGGADKTVKLWNLATLDLVRTYRGADDFITSIALSADGKLVAAASLDGSIRLWSTSSSSLRRRLDGHQGSINQIAFSPDSKRLVSAGHDGTVRLWDIERRRSIRAFAGHRGEVKAAVFTPDGQRIATAGADGTIRLWSAATDDGDG